MKKALSILLVLVFCLSLVGCASPAPAAPEAAAAPAAAAEPAAPAQPAENTEAVADASRTDRESIVIALQGELTNLDHQFSSDDGNLRPISWNIFEPLVRLNGQTLEPEGVLATEWNQVDDTTMEFKLRQGVTFHDGDTFDADDVVYSIARVTDPEFNSQLLSSIETIDHAEKVDDYTVRVITKQADPILVTRLAMLPIYSKSFTEARTAAEMATVANGTGPYKYVEWKSGDYCAITAFDGYWGEAPAIKNVKFRFLEEKLTAQAALQAGEVDLAVDMIPEYVPNLPKAISQTSNECYWIRFNQINDGTFKSKENRLAAAYAVDTKAISDALFQGYASASDGQMGRPGYTGYSESVKAYEYNVDKAKELMAASGYAGEEVQLTTQRERWLQFGEVSEAVASYLMAVGFNVSTQFLSWNEWLEMLFDKERVPDLFASSNGNDFFDLDRPMSVCASSKGNQSAVPASEWDDKIAAAQSEMDPAARQALYDEINQHFFEDPFALYLMGVDALYGAAVDLDWEARKDTQILVSEMAYAS